MATNTYDFIGEAGKAVPYGVYDVGTNTGWVNVGTDADTGMFAVESIRRWWTTIGSHLPPGTSKWNKIEHRMFSAITMNWRGRPLETHEVVVETIAATTTKPGSRCRRNSTPTPTRAASRSPTRK